MKKFTGLRWGIMSGLGLLLSGCLSLERTEPSRQSFDFAPQLPQAAAPDQGPTLLVSYFATEPQFATGEFVYRISDVQWQSDFYRHWVDAPAALLTDWTRRWLAGSGRFRNVGTPGLLAGSQANLQGRIVELYGDFRAESPTAVITLAFNLQPGGTKAQTPIWAKTYHRSIPLTRSSPDALVEAWNRGLEEILRDLSREVALVLRQNPTD
jgi:cholesterol transport system auxiliary component